MKNIKKLLALFIAAMIVISAVSSVFVFAEEEISVKMGFEIKRNSLTIGESFRINTTFDFDGGVETASGIPVFRHGLVFDSNVFDFRMTES